ncbi:MAG: hypothetical protein HRT57_13520 [Crocinitomicaceae bacterium]|nr:hypothetical protein [Crocinitomicaceae bacterium]
MINFKSIFLFACSFSILIACSDKPDEKEPIKKKNTPSQVYQDDNEEFEEYITQIDDSATLNEGNSLYYTHSNGTSYEVTFKINNDDRILRMTEKYTLASTGSIMSSVFYYKDELLYATKEFFEEGVGEDAFFVERVSYYDKNSEPTLTKERTAPFEDYLDQSSFKLGNIHKCSDERAYRAITNQGEFMTTFKGFVENGPERYLMVGEDKKGGYESAILLQSRTPFLQYLFHNQDSNIGMKLDINFRTMRDPAGYEYQALLGAFEVIE